MNLTPQKKVITSHAEITRAMTIIKSCHEGFMTNFFFGEKRCELLIKKQVLFIITCNKCAFILHKDFDFYHLYYITTNNDMLTKSLEILTEKFPNERFVSDIVGMKTAVSNIVPVFECFGFKKYSQLYRMSRVKNLDEPQHLDERVKYAKLEHAEQIKTLLEQYFDPYSEQIPMIDEIRKQIETQSILIVAEKENIIGFVIFEINGVTSYLRYWFTHPDHRDKKVGSALLRHFFYECRTTKRQLFWVIENNENAIVRYKHYGFEQEQLFDQIMIRNKNMRQEIIKILNELRPEFDFNQSVDFIEEGMLDSFDVVTLVTTLDEKFGISIDGVDVLPENFSSVEKIETLLKKNGVN